MREEALDVLKTTNLWVHLRVFYRDIDDRAARGLLQNGLQHRQPVLCTGHLERSAVYQNATLEIIVTKADLPKSANSEKSQDVLFTYSQMTHAHLSRLLWDNVDNYDILVARSKQSSVPKGLDVIKTFLRPLSIIRGVKATVLFSTEASDPVIERIQKDIMSTVAWDWKKIICAQKSFQARGNRAFRNQRYVEAMYHYDRGGFFSHNVGTLAMKALLDFSSSWSKESYSICCVTNSNYALAVNKLVENRRATSAACESIGVSLEQLTLAIIAACDAFWVACPTSSDAKPTIAVALPLRIELTTSSSVGLHPSAIGPGSSMISAPSQTTTTLRKISFSLCYSAQMIL